MSSAYQPNEPPEEAGSVRASRTGTNDWIEVQQTQEFAELRRRVRGFVFPMTVAFLAWYLLYVLMSAYARGFMTQKLLGNINVAYVFGLLQFISTFVIALIYSRYMDRSVDPISDRLRSELEAKGKGR